MNIVSNNCTGGFIYSELLHSRFSNPFIWCRVSLDDFLFLMQYWDSINFLNARLVKHGELLDDTAPFAIRVDDKFEIRYTHYYFNSRCETPEARQYGRGTSFFFKQNLGDYHQKIHQPGLPNEFGPNFCYKRRQRKRACLGKNGSAIKIIGCIQISRFDYF